MGDLNKYTVAALREELRSRELLTEGKKEVLVERLRNSIILEQQRINRPVPEEFLNVELSVEQVDSANEGNANLVERGEEQPTEKSIQQELESVKRELVSVKREKELLQQKLDFQKRKNESMQRELNKIKQSNVSLQCEIRPANVTSTSSRNTSSEFNRRNICK